MKQEYEEKIHKIAEDVQRYLAQSLKKHGSPYDTLKEAMAYSANAGGKRIRPVLCVAFAELFGGVYEHGAAPCMRSRNDSHLQLNSRRSALYGR